MTLAETLSTKEERTRTLRAAADAKRHAAIRRAEDGIRRLAKSGAAINFRSVAASSSVSVNFLYTNANLRSRIEHLRRQQQEKSSPRSVPKDDGQSSVVRSLTAKLATERREHQAEVAELKKALAAAHGELLALRRAGATGRASNSR